MLNKRLMISFILVLVALLAVAPTIAQDADLEGDFTVSHCFGGEFIEELVDGFVAANPGINREASPVDHEQFKTSILVQLAGGNPPDTFSYWAGASIQFIVDGDCLQSIDDVWNANEMDAMFPQAVIDTPSTYNGEKYAVPLTLHWVGMFYNTTLFEQVGAEIPETWDELGAVAELCNQWG